MVNQALSVLCFSIGFFCVFCAAHTAHFDYVALFCVCVLSLVCKVGLVMLSVPVQVIDWKDS